MSNAKNNSVNPVGLIIGVLIWVVGLLGLGVEVTGLGTAFIAGIAIEVVGVITWLPGLLKLKVGGVQSSTFSWEQSYRCFVTNSSTV